MGGDEEEEEVLGSGQSASTNNSLPPPVDKTILKLNHLDVHADDAGSHASLASVTSLYSILMHCTISFSSLFFQFHFYFL